MNKKASGFFSKILALSFVMLILGMLILSGPAQAFIINMDVNKNFVKKGEIIKFDISLKIDQNESTLPIQQISLILDGPIQRSCVFSPEVQIISGCTGIINITKLTSTSTYGYGQNPSYGYGYGYSAGELKYQILMDSSLFAPGIYDSILSVKVGNNFYNYQGNRINIKSSSKLEDKGTTTRSLDTYHKVEEDILTLLPNSEYIMKIKDEYHIIKVNSINKDKIDLAISSNLQELSLTPSEIYEIDIERDGENDLQISVWYINEKEAVLHFESERTIVFEKVLFKEEKIEQSYLAQDQLPKQSIVEENQPKLIEPKFLIIFLGLLVLAEIVGIVIAFFRKS
ncbi:MAG: hypothetical protein QXI33_02240 [Candidatus Pacearchaeota archaeon]